MKHIYFSVLFFLSTCLAFGQIPTYDVLGRIVQEVYPDGTVISYTYDAGGNRIVHLIDAPNPCFSNIGLVAYYPFNGNANDASGNGLNGVTSGNPVYATGVFGQALNTQSSAGQYITVANHSLLQNVTTLSISSWVNPSSFDLGCWADMEHLICKGKDEVVNSYSIAIKRNSSGSCVSAPAFTSYNLEFYYGGNFVSTPIYSVNNQWQHVVGTYDGNVIRIYLNGVLAAQQTIGTVNAVNTLPLYINKHTWNGGSSSRYGGKIDEVRIYNRALDSTEVQALYSPQPIANFTSVANALDVTFTNASTNVSANTSYSWNFGNGQTSTLANPSVSYAVSDTYNVCLVVTNACGSHQVCNSVTVVCTPPTATISNNTSPTCSGGTNGSATVSVTGGVAPYTYTWSSSPAQYTATANNLSAGTYTVTVKDAVNCPTTATVTLTQPTAFAATISAQNNVSCYAGVNGSATVSASGGTSPYTYTWNTNPVQNTANTTNLSAGNYTVTVKDAHNCTTTANVNITQPNALTATINQTNVLCNGMNTGTATAVPLGGTAPYTYTWGTNPIQYTATANNLLAGNYSLSVKDVHNCITNTTVTITQPNPLIGTISAQTNVSCNGGTNGSATVSVSGGLAPYTYTWNTTPPKYTATATVLSSGNYAVTVKDANNCTTTVNVSITQPNVLSATTTQTNVSCNGGTNGTATASVSGGTSPYTYTWNTSPVQYTPTASNLGVGTFTLTVKDAKNCSATSTVSITQPTALSLSTTQVNISCIGGTTGSATVVASGGTSPYTYTWNTSPPKYTAAATNLSAGTYTVTVKDNKNCIQTATVTLNAPVAMTGTTTVTNVSCFGGNNGTASVVASGGIAPYTYTWNSSPIQYAATANNLIAGNYSVVIKDANACSLTKNVSITQPTNALSAMISSVNNVLCNGGANGTASIVASGGTAPYTYTWNTNPSQYTASATGLSVGTYTVSVVDSKGCITNTSVSITEPSVLSLSLTSSAINCYGGSNGTITATTNGGVAPYEYKKNTGAYTSNNVFTGLIAGTYTITVRDANNCTYSQTITVSQPSQIALSTPISKTNISCNGANNGEIMPIITGGSGSFTYTWNTNPVQYSLNAINLGVGSYTLTVVDGNGCSFITPAISITQPNVLVNNTVAINNPNCYGGANGSVTTTTSGGTSPYTYTWNTNPPKFTSNATGLIAGTYTLNVIDNNGCMDTTMVTINQPTAVSFSTLIVQNITCNGAANGSISVIGSGGVTPYTYNLNNQPYNNTGMFTNLSAGNYTIHIKDAHNCIIDTLISITQPAILTSNVSINQPLCFGNTGNAIVNTVGGTTPYNYSWSSGQITASVSNLAIGTYTVTTTDINACTNAQTITISQPNDITLAINTTSPLCYGQQGIISATATGGTGNLNYNWSSGQITPNITVLAGAYTLSVTDNNGCTETVTTILNQPLPLAVSGLIVPVSCPNGINGSANLVVTGGTSPYTYSWWHNGATTSLVTGLSAGNYNVSVWDVNGCETLTTVNMTEPVAPVFNITYTNANCYGTPSGTANMVATGGATPYTYSWSNGINTAIATGLYAGLYYATLTDALGCHYTDSVAIEQPISIQVYTSQINVSCNGDNNGTAVAIATNGNAPYSFSWSNGILNANAGNLFAGTYTVVVTDAQGCTTTDSVNISEPQSVSITYNTVEPTCSNNTNGSITIVAQGGNGSPYIYSWANGQTGSTITGIAAGTYTVYVYDSLNCESSELATLLAPMPPTISYTTNQISCNGANDGNISALVISTIGETFTYSWSNGTEGQSIQNLSPGTYISYITSNLGCIYSDTITITEPAPLVVVTNNPQPGIAVASAYGGTAPYTYTWNTTPVQYADTITGLMSGIYEVNVVDANGCKKDTVIRIEYSTGVLEISEGTSINLYPNPTNGLVNIEIYFEATNCVSLQLTNNLGQELMKTDLICGKELIYQFDIKKYADGVYYVNLLSSDKLQTHTIKVIKN